MSLVIAVLSRLNRVNLELCRVASILLCGAIVGIVAAGVFFRYVLNDSLSWAEELSKFCMLWLVFVGSPIALRAGNHIAIEILPGALPERMAAILRTMVMAIVITFLFILIWKSWGFAANGWNQTAIAIGDVSMFWIFVAIPVGSASMLLVAVQLFFEHLTRVFGGTPPVDPFLVRYASDLTGQVSK
ncbi:MAG: TRAP transporter small permease [Pseudomonadota bacterium]